MSRLRDGIHRRALLTARFGSARFGASRFGWTPGQEDFEGEAREIKDVNYTGVGPFYIWTERYINEAPFGNVDQNIPAITGWAGLFTLASTILQRGTTFIGQFTLASQVASAKANVTGNLNMQSADQPVWTFTDV